MGRGGVAALGPGTYIYIYLIISLGGWEISEIPGISGLRARNVHGYARVRTNIYIYIIYMYIYIYSPWWAAYFPWCT